jgi:predicted phage terminase large subunit-like protein
MSEWSPSEQRHLRKRLQGADLEALMAEVSRLKHKDAREHFLPFVARVWPEFVRGRHHAVMSEVFERVESGKVKRVVINLPPRHTKSRFASVLFPAWYLGRHPDHKIMECSHTASLALDFGRDLRNLVATPEYQAIFPALSLSADKRAAGRWNTSEEGQYFAIGKTGAAAGRGGDLVIIDDPHSEQSVIENPKLDFEKTWQWYLAGPRQRLQPGAAIVVVMTRWGELDLTGQLRRAEIEDEEGESWELIQLPAILPSGDPLFPEYWSIEELQRTKATMPVARWSANYQQEPTGEEGAIIKREHWRNWEQHDPPVCDYIVQSWDTAFSTKEAANRSACITWGVFRRKQHTTADEPIRIETGIILLDAWVRRVDFPTLKSWAKKLYEQWKPDTLVIERGAAGLPLIQELWRAGVPTYEANPSRTKDKLTRTHAVADLFHSGMVWAPLRSRWVTDVVEEMAAFPNGANDDLHDAAVWGLLRIREGNFIRTASDETEEEEYQPRPRREYY